MRKIAEIRKDLNALIAEIKGVDASNVEAMDKATEKLRALTAELNLANEAEAAEQRLAENKFNDLQEKAGRRFSFVKFIREISTNSLSGLEAEVAEMGAEEYKRLGLAQTGHVIPSAVLRSTGQNYTTDADGGYLKETMAIRYTESLKEKLVVTKLGATVLTDLIGTVPVVSSAQISSAWAGEGSSPTAVTKAVYSRLTMTPHRNVTKCAFTKDLLRQTSFDVEADLINKMTEAHANLLEKAAIAGSGQNNEPKGILTECTALAGNLIEIGTNGGPITWKNVVKLETIVNSVNANRGRLGYLANAKVCGELKTIERTSGNGKYLLSDDGKLNGYPFEWTNLCPSNLTKGTSSACSAMIFGNFQDLFIGEWGGIDIVVDIYTKAAEGEVVLVLNAWNDCLVAEPKSFAAIKDITVG